MRSGVRLSPSRSGFSPSSDSSRRTKVASSRFDTSDSSSASGAGRVSRRGSPRVFCSIALSGLVNAPLRMIDMSQADGVGSIYQSATPNTYCRLTFTCARCAAACTRGHGRRYHALYGRNLPLSVMTTRSPLGFSSLVMSMEVDRAHDAVAEFLVDKRLNRVAIDVDHLIEAVDQRVGRHRLVPVLVRADLQRLRDIVAERERLAQGACLVLGHAVHAETGGGRPDRRHVDGRRDLLPRHT